VTCAMQHRTMTIVAALAAAATTNAQQYQWRALPWLGSPVAISTAFDTARARTVLVRARDTWEFDGAVWRRTVANNPMGERWDPAFAFDRGRGVVVLFSGQRSGPLASDTWEYDGNSWTLVNPTAVPTRRSRGAMVYDTVRQRIYLFGGHSNTAMLGDTWEFDGSTWTQHFPANSPNPIDRHAMAFDQARGVTVLFGGRDVMWNEQDATWEWDGIDWSLRMPTARPPARALHAMAYDAGRARTVVFGGGAVPTQFDDTWEWDGNVWTQRAAGLPAPPARGKHAMSYDPLRGETVMLDRWSGGNDTWTFDGNSWQVAVPAESPGSSRAHALAYDHERRETLLFGQGHAFLVTETWVHRGGWWHRRQPATTPSGRADPALTFDPVTRTVLMFGGDAPAAVDETWLWNGIDWQLQSPATAPPPRSASALASDTARNRVVLFGGTDGSQPLGDTWEWDGTNWLQRTPATAPQARHNHGMAFDPNRNRSVLFGGGDLASGPTLGDHWEWDGTNWTQITGVTLPPPRAKHGQIYDSVTQTVVVLGGAHGPATFPLPRTDAWEWNGATWSQRPITGGLPATRTFTRAAYDPEIRRAITYGGDDYFDTWSFGLQSGARTLPYGGGCPGTHGLPNLRPRGEPLLGNLAFRIEASSLVPGNLTFVVYGLQPTTIALSGGCTALTDTIAYAAAVNDARGAIVLPLPLPNVAVLQGTRLFLQAAAVDQGGALGGLGALSAGLEITVDR